MGTATLPLVGRERELHELGVLLDDAGRGRGRVAVVSGEAGAGKTALLDTTADLARSRGFSVAGGRAAESEMPPYWPWPQVLAALPAGGAATESPFARTPAGGNPALFAAVLDHLASACRAGPALLLVDDLHWADESALALAGFIAAALPALPAVLLFGARDEPGDLPARARDLLAALPADVVRLHLGGVDGRATAEIIAGVLGHPPAPDLAAEVHARTGGHPLFVKEVARLYAAQGQPSALVVPEGVRQVLARRLARLSQGALGMLAAAAVADAFDAELLAALTGQPVSAVLTQLDDAEAARLVVASSDGHQFTHALVRQAVYEDTAPSRRIDLHQRMAELLEAAARAEAGGGASSTPARASWHWAQVPGSEARQRAAALARQAAHTAMANLGYPEAVRHLRRALELGGGDDLEATVELGEAEVLAGRVTDGRRTLAAAADRAQAAGAGDLLARAVLASGTGVGGFEVDVGDERQAVQLRRALQLLPEGDRSWRAAVLARLALVDARSPQAERVTMAREAAALAAAAGDQRTLVSAWAAQCDAIAGPDHVDERIDITARMVALAEADGDPFMLLLARRHRLEALLERGDITGVDEQIAAYARTADRLRLPLFSWLVPLWHGMRALMDGDFVAADHEATEAARLGAAAASPNADTLACTLRWAVARTRGDTSPVDGDVSRHVALYAGYPPVDGMHAVHLVLTGRPDAARGVLRRRLSAGLHSIPHDSEWLETLWNLGDAAIALGELDAVEQIYAALLPYDSLWAIDGVGAVCMGVVAHQLGHLAYALGRTGDARRWLAAAHAAHADAGARHLTATTAKLLELVDGEGGPGGGGGGRRTPPPVAGDEGEARRSGAVWYLRWQGREITVRHSKGMVDIARLLADPGKEQHVLDLAGGQVSEGDTGPVVDDQARRAYRQRLVDLEADLAEAEADADQGRIRKYQQERDFLIDELTASLGLGGRQRVTGDATERARKAVTMRVRTALRAIAAADAGLGRHLDRSLVTGRFCSYQPETPVTWHVDLG